MTTTAATARPQHTTATAGGWIVSQERYPRVSRSWIGAITTLWRSAWARLSGFGNIGKTW